MAKPRPDTGQLGAARCVATRFRTTTGRGSSTCYRGGHGGVARGNRGFVNAVWYVAETGIPWRDLPDRFGKWDTAFHRFNAWCQAGVWRREFEAVRDSGLE